MTKEELANKFLEIDIEALNYIQSITLDYKRCLRDDEDYDEMIGRIYLTLSEIENLKIDYETQGGCHG